MKKLTEFDCGGILALNEQGMPIRNIEKETGIPRSTIGYLIKKNIRIEIQ
jgi:hypothetical protein